VTLDLDHQAVSWRLELGQTADPSDWLRRVGQAAAAVCARYRAERAALTASLARGEQVYGWEASIDDPRAAEAFVRGVVVEGVRAALAREAGGS
jgi:hypothetical protein